jgi:hypothetical protein
MALVTDIAFTSTLSSMVMDDVWTSLVGGPLTVNGLGFVAQLQGYVLGLGEGARIRFVIDGTEVVKASPLFGLTYMQLLPVGTHTVDFQAIGSGDGDEPDQAGPRGLSVVDLGVVVPAV